MVVIASQGATNDGNRTMTTTAKLDTAGRKALLAQMIQEHGAATLVEDLACTFRDLEEDSRDRATADAWAEMASALYVAQRYVLANNATAMQDFAPAAGYQPCADLAAKMDAALAGCSSSLDA